MPGYPIQLRRITDPDNIIDFLYPCEIVLDTVAHRLCISTGGAVISYPSIDIPMNEFTLASNYVLYNYEQTAGFSWSTTDGLDVYAGGQTASIGLGGQTLRLARDARINNGGVQSLETFHTTPNRDWNTLSFTYTEYNVETIGNLYVHVEKPSVNIDKSIQLGYNNSYQAHNGVRNKNNDTYASALIKSGGLRISGNGVTPDPYFAGIFARSHVYYPDAARHKLTVYLTYFVDTVPASFSTRIGYPGNWQDVNTNLSSTSVTKGAVVLHYNPEKTLTSNLSKTLTIDWCYDLIASKTPGVAISRGICIANMSIFPGWLTAEEITPSYDESTMSRLESQMYSTGVRQKTMYGRDYHYVNFDVPLVSDRYTVDTLASGYALEISEKTMYGFRVRGPAAPVATPWSFTYRAHCKG